MTPREIRSNMHTIAGELLESNAGGVHWSAVVAQFTAVHSDDLDGLSELLRDDYLHRLAKDAVDAMRRDDNGQVALPGFDAQIDATVTTTDGEGGYIVKRIAFATETDLLQDFDLHESNVRATVNARSRANRRNRVLIPVMQTNGFATAGEAIEFLQAGVA